MESLTSQLERRLEWRNKVLELSSQGQSQAEIATVPHVGVATINRDLSHLRKRTKNNIKKYIDERLPVEYEKCMVGLNSILREAWYTSQIAEDKREKMLASSLAKECYVMKLDLLTNATVVDDAIRFVDAKSSNLIAKASIQEQENETVTNKVF